MQTVLSSDLWTEVRKRARASKSRNGAIRVRYFAMTRMGYLELTVRAMIFPGRANARRSLWLAGGSQDHSDTRSFFRQPRFAQAFLEVLAKL
jgi:hypothetical protein